jgi:hypothetical protein
MKYLLCLPVILLTACASTPPPVVQSIPQTPPIYALHGYKGPEAMESIEVVQASKQCIFAKMRPNVNYLAVRTEQGKVLVPVSVNCEPF